MELQDIGNPRRLIPRLNVSGSQNPGRTTTTVRQHWYEREKENAWNTVSLETAISR